MGFFFKLKQVFDLLFSPYYKITLMSGIINCMSDVSNKPFQKELYELWWIYWSQTSYWKRWPGTPSSRWWRSLHVLNKLRLPRVIMHIDGFLWRVVPMAHRTAICWPMTPCTLRYFFGAVRVTKYVTHHLMFLTDCWTVFRLSCAREQSRTALVTCMLKWK